MELSVKEIRRLHENIARQKFMDRAAEEWNLIFSVIEPQGDGYGNYAGQERGTRKRIYKSRNRTLSVAKRNHGKRV